MKTVEPNLPRVMVTTEFDADIEDVFLGEFASAEVRHIVTQDVAGEDEETVTQEPVATANGVKIVRLISQDHQVVAQYDPIADCVDLTHIAENDQTLIASTHPSSPKYLWQLVLLGKVSDDKKYAPIIGVRLADENETDFLNKAFPNWLEMCKAFDDKAAAQNSELEVIEELKSDIKAPTIQ